MWFAVNVPLRGSCELGTRQIEDETSILNQFTTSTSSVANIHFHESIHSHLVRFPPSQGPWPAEAMLLFLEAFGKGFHLIGDWGQADARLLSLEPFDKIST